MMRSIILLKNKRESVYVGVKTVLCRNISIIFYSWLFYTEFSVSAVLRLTVTVCPKSVWERRQRRGTADIGIKSVNAEMSKVSLLSLGAGQNVALYASPTARPEVTLCSWQDVTFQSLINFSNCLKFGLRCFCSSGLFSFIFSWVTFSIKWCTSVMNT